MGRKAILIAMAAASAALVVSASFTGAETSAVLYYLNISILSILAVGSTALTFIGEQ